MRVLRIFISTPREQKIMKTLNLNAFFEKVGYDWLKDKENIKTICHYTKTRVNDKMTEVKLGWGTEQTFLVKAVAEWIGAKSFFEIGTGRGTACYALSLLDSIKDIHTVDILNFNQKFATAIGYKPATVSLSDIRNMIPFPQKNKVNFHHRIELTSMQRTLKNSSDLCFIDGDHTNKSVILADYAACLDIMKDDGIILWDDYDPDRFAVKGIVEELLANNSELDAVLVEQRGHLFNDEKPLEHGKGVVLMKKGKLFNGD